MDRIPGQFYRDSENRLYQLVTVARHRETGEEMAVYQALYGAFQVFACPLARFEDSFRTELKRKIDGEEGDDGQASTDAGAEKTLSSPHPLLMRFLEETELDGQLAALNQMRGKITQRELDSIYFSLDMVPMEGEPDQQLRGIIRALETRRKYDGRRLR